MKESIGILYEDNDMVALNKPAGLIVHEDGVSKGVSLVDWIAKKYPETKGVGDIIETSHGGEVDRHGIVHRLDKDTSGVVLVAKNVDTYTFLKQQFLDRETVKVYRAFTYGQIKDDRGMIDRPIGRSGKDFRLRSAQRGARGELKDALTYFRVLKRAPLATYVEVMPKTGRIHQIRAHFKAINYPLVCDSLYAEGKSPILSFERLALHALSLEIMKPNGKMLRVEAPLPPDFLKAEVELAEIIASC